MLWLGSICKKQSFTFINLMQTSVFNRDIYSLAFGQINIQYIYLFLYIDRIVYNIIITYVSKHHVKHVLCRMLRSTEHCQQHFLQAILICISHIDMHPVRASLKEVSRKFYGMNLQECILCIIT